MSQNTVELERPLMTIWRRVACWISKSTRMQARAFSPAHAQARTHTCAHTHPEKYLLLTAFSRQLRSRKGDSLSRYTYIASRFQIRLLNACLQGKIKNIFSRSCDFSKFEKCSCMNPLEIKIKLNFI